jgi:hypothetical protein
MKMIEIDFNPGARALRQFGLIALVAFPTLGLLCYRWGGLFGLDFGGAALSVSLVLVGLGVVSGVLSWLAPRAIRPLYVTLLVITVPIGFVLSYGILGVLFYGVITPMALLFRLVGFDPLHRSFERDVETYWVEVRPRASKESYFRQF